jgi:hypothetical protein
MPMEQQEQPQQDLPAGVDERALAAVTRLTLAAMKIIFDPNASKQLLEMMQGDPVQGLVQAAKTVLSQLQEKSKGLPQGFALRVAPSVVKNLMDLGEAAGVLKADPQLAQQVLAQLKGQPAKATPEAAPEAAPEAPTEQPQGLIAQGA